MGISGVGNIMKLVAFILVAVAFALSFFVFKVGGANGLLVAAVFGGFFGYYLAAFLGMLLGGEIDAEVSKTWAIYATCALFGVGISIIMGRCGDSTECTLVMVSGICGICASVFCFLEAIFSE